MVSNRKYKKAVVPKFVIKFWKIGIINLGKSILLVIGLIVATVDF